MLVRLKGGEDEAEHDGLVRQWSNSGQTVVKQAKYFIIRQRSEALPPSFEKDFHWY